MTSRVINNYLLGVIQTCINVCTFSIGVDAVVAKIRAVIIDTTIITIKILIVNNIITIITICEIIIGRINHLANSITAVHILASSTIGIVGIASLAL